MPWRTDQENYGQFTNVPGRTSLGLLPKRRKRAYQDRLLVKYPTSQAEYGNFYTKGTDKTGLRTYQVNKNFMLPVLGTWDPTVLDKTPSPVRRKERSPDSCKDSSGSESPNPQVVPCGTSVHLPDINRLNLQILTKDKAKVNFKQSRDGRFDFTSKPNTKKRFRLPEVEEVRLQFRQKDGYVYDIHSRPK